MAAPTGWLRTGLRRGSIRCFPPPRRPRAPHCARCLDSPSHSNTPHRPRYILWAKESGGGQFEIGLEELSECIGDNNHFEERIILKDSLNDFLRNIPQKNREIFMMRYWYMMSVHNIAERQGISEGSVKMILQRLRNKLKVHLEREGITI